MKILNLIKITQALKREFQNGRHFHATIAVKGGNIILIVFPSVCGFIPKSEVCIAFSISFTTDISHG